MFIPDPDFLFIPSILDSRILNPTTTKEEGGKVLLSYFFFVATNFTILKIILFLNRYLVPVQKKIEPIYKELRYILPMNLSPSS